MKKCLTYIAALIIVVLILDRILSVALDTIVDKSDFRYVNMFQENPDLYVVGNSRAVYAVWESEFDKKYDLDVLNVSFTRLNSESIQHLTKSIKKDKVLYIEVSAFLSPHVNEKGEISPVFSSIKGLRNKNTNVTDNFSNLFKSYNFNNRLTLRLLYHIFKSDKTWSQRREINESILTKIDRSDGHSLYIKKQFYDYLKFLKQENYNFVFFHAPYHPLHREKIFNLHKINQELNDILGNRFMNLTDLVNEDIYFADAIHTNFRAAVFIHEKIEDKTQKLIERNKVINTTSEE